MERHSVVFGMVLGICFLTLSAPAAQNSAQKEPLVSALYMFGDSTIDPGNNNGIATIAKANFPPYGRDFPNGRPTGRFTNGRLITDQLSELAGLPDLLPASLDPDFSGQKLLTGASFGSAAAGYVDSTSLPVNAIPLQKQVENFRHYRAQLVDMIGQQNANNIISRALFVISTGTDDFANNYFLNPLTTEQYSVAQFEDLQMQSLSGFIQNVYTEGGTLLAIIGLPPFGCLPAQITLHNFVGNACVEEMNEVARSFNTKITVLVEKMNLSFPCLLLFYLNIYDKLYDMVKYPSKYGFEEARKGCCGTGLLETAILCNNESPTCPDASKYVFWDSFHPTTAAYNIIANDIFQQALMILGKKL